MSKMSNKIFWIKAEASNSKVTNFSRQLYNTGNVKNVQQKIFWIKVEASNSKVTNFSRQLYDTGNVKNILQNILNKSWSFKFKSNQL